jgi:hypothetical protein
VSLLHLRFWNATIALTRPFLLFAVAKMDRQQTGIIPVKRRIYEQMSKVCLEAAEQGAQIIRRMREEGTLSSLLLLDCHYISDTMWVLILSLLRHRGAERQEMLRFCLDTVKSMEQVGWTEKVTQELESRVNESGVLEVQAGGGGGGVLLPMALQGQQQYSFWPMDEMSRQMGPGDVMSVAMNSHISPTSSSDYMSL